MNKYNEIMSNVTVDPEMKIRVMSAVSAAIREQSDKNGTTEKAKLTRKPEVRQPEVIRPEAVKPDAERNNTGRAEVSHVGKKKAKKIPIAVISSIAAGILVIAGILLFFSRYLDSAKSASSTLRMHNAEATTAGRWNYDSAAAETVGNAEYAEEYEATTTVPESADAEADTGDDSVSGKNELNSITNGNTGDNNYKNSLTVDVTYETGSRYTGMSDASEGTGDARLDAVKEALPFDIMGSGSGEYSEGITKEVFFGVDGEKVLLMTAPEGTDLVKTVFHGDSDTFVEGTTPAGMPVKFYRVAFADVKDLENGETSSDVNAAVFTRDGKTYLLVFSDIQPSEVIGRVADVM